MSGSYFERRPTPRPSRVACFLGLALAACLALAAPEPTQAGCGAGGCGPGKGLFARIFRGNRQAVTYQSTTTTRTRFRLLPNVPQGYRAPIIVSGGCAGGTCRR